MTRDRDVQSSGLSFPATAGQLPARESSAPLTKRREATTHRANAPLGAWPDGSTRFPKAVVELLASDHLPGKSAEPNDPSTAVPMDLVGAPLVGSKRIAPEALFTADGTHHGTLVLRRRLNVNQQCATVRIGSRHGARSLAPRYRCFRHWQRVPIGLASGDRRSPWSS